LVNIKGIPSLSLITAGSLDWLTTIIGITYFGAVEGNPIMAQLMSSSLFAYSAIKIITTIIVGLIFYKAEKILRTVENKNSNGFTLTLIGLRGSYIAATVALLIAVLNNIFVVSQAI
jgi:hypothetical protein